MFTLAGNHTVYHTENFSICQNASDNEDYASIVDVGALLVTAGDPAGEDDPIRKGTAFQVCPFVQVTSQCLT